MLATESCPIIVLGEALTNPPGDRVGDRAFKEVIMLHLVEGRSPNSIRRGTSLMQF